MVKNKKTVKKNAVNMFFSGVIILTVANILVKSVGLISKIVLNTIVGSEGAGYYSSAYEIYAFLYVISTSGLPVAISILVSKCRARGKLREAKKILNVSLLVFFVIGLVLASLMIAFSGNLADIISAPETKICIMAVAPTILFVCISSCLRGYFQGYQQMQPTGVSQFIEALSKVLIGVGFALYAKAQGYDDYTVAAFTILGVTLGVFFGMVYLFIRRLIFKEKEYYLEVPPVKDEKISKSSSILREIAFIAIPITLSSAVLSLTTIIDTFMVQGRLLEFGLNEELVRIYYGDYTTLVISMVNLPTILIYPIANALVPLISSVVANKREDRSTSMRALSMRVINMISIPCAIGLSIFSKPILDLLMFTQASVDRASLWLSIGAISVIFLGVIAATNTFLNTAGKQALPIVSMVAGAVVKLICNYFLIGSYGIIGAPISTLLCYVTAACLNMFFVYKHVGKLPNLSQSFGIPLICARAAIGIPAVIYIFGIKYIGGKILTVACIMLSVFLYLLLIFKTRAVTKDELLLLPNGKKIVKILKKVKML